MRVLIVEDDEILRGAVETGLAMNGFTVDAVDTLEDARAALSAWPYDAVVLDIALPDGSGFDLLKEWRTSGAATPVLMLTARNATRDRIHGLDLGADDYLGKPFDLDELAARVRAIARRAHGRAAPVLAWRDVTLDPAARTVCKAGEAVPLSRREFAVLRALMEQPEHVRSRAQLEDSLYGWQEEVGSNAIDVHVHKLRTKLGREMIETVRGEGYRMRRA